MRPFAAVLLLFAAALLAAALLAYPAWLLVTLLDDQPIHRVLHRIAMVFVLFGLLWLGRRWRLLDRPSSGFGLSRKRFWQQLTVGLLGGTAIILPLVGILLMLGIRAPRADFAATAMSVAGLIAAGLATGLIVALIEETFFRGVLFTAIQRSSGIVPAIVLPSLLYASVHFLGGRLFLPAEQIEWSSGLAVLGNMFNKYGDPAAIVDSFLALFAVGVLLAFVRLRTGSIAACIGMHAAWVGVITFVKRTTALQPVDSASWLVGSYDGVLGWAALGWMATMTIVYLLLARNVRTPLNAGDAEQEQRA